MLLINVKFFSGRFFQILWPSQNIRTLHHFTCQSRWIFGRKYALPAIVVKWNVVVCYALLQQPRRFATCWNFFSWSAPCNIWLNRGTFKTVLESEKKYIFKTIILKVFFNEIDALHCHHHFIFGFLLYIKLLYVEAICNT